MTCGPVNRKLRDQKNKHFQNWVNENYSDNNDPCK